MGSIWGALFRHWHGKLVQAKLVHLLPGSVRCQLLLNLGWSTISQQVTGSDCEGRRNFGHLLGSVLVVIRALFDIIPARSLLSPCVRARSLFFAFARCAPLK